MNYPRSDLFELCKVRNATFWPMHRQELSRAAGGRTQAKDLGSALWRASFTTSPASLADASDIEAALISLNGSAGSFLAHDVRRPFPRAHADGEFEDVATISALNVGGRAFAIRLTGMPQGFTLSPGDYIGFQYGPQSSRALHMVTVGGQFGGQGNLTIDVFPAVRVGASVGSAVTFKRPPCEMILEPGQQPPAIEGLVASSVTFTGVQVL
ncbi:MAG: hypothetical protein EpisKO_05800 [Epibacterium sp.]